MKGDNHGRTTEKRIIFSAPDQAIGRAVGVGLMSIYDDAATSDDALKLDASEIAPMLGLTPERLMAELRAGEVYHAAEEPGADEDGRLLITFRYRARIARLIVEADGTMHPESRLTH